MSYTQSVELKNNETLAKVNTETGEVTTVKKRVSNIPEGKEIFEPEGIFRKDYTKSWKYLKSNLTAFEFSVAFELALLAKANTNSLEPLSDSTTVNQLVEKFNISRNKVKPLFNKLFKLGVYAKFEVYDVTKPYTKYWILNPYLSFSGKLINSDIARLFSGTKITLHYYDKVINEL
jgi:hypothetical protein